MQTTSLVPAPREREPGGRLQAGRRGSLGPVDVARVHRAVLDLLAAGGPSACTLDEISAQLEMSKATLYRQWAGKSALMIDALGLSALHHGAIDTKPGGTLTDALVAFDRRLYSSWGQALRASARFVDQEPALRRARSQYFTAVQAATTDLLAATSASPATASRAAELAISVPTARWAQGMDQMRDDQIDDLTLWVTTIAGSAPPPG